MDESPLRIAVPPGIGDAHWSMMKARALKAMHGRKLHVYIGHTQHHNTANYLQLIPFVDAVKIDMRLGDMVANMKPSFSDKKFSMLAGSKNWNGFEYIFCANGHLEAGCMLTTWMPELDIDWMYDLNIRNETFTLIDRKIGHGRTILYLSGTGPNKSFHAGWWKPEWWIKIISGLNAEGIEPVIIGANNGHDKEYLSLVKMQSGGKEIRFMDLIGMTTHEEVMAIIKMAKVWCGLNSGTGIVSASMGTPTVMLWSDHAFRMPGVQQYLHSNMKRSWLTEWQLEKYRTLSYGDPATTTENVLRNIFEVMRKE